MPSTNRDFGYLGDNGIKMANCFTSHLLGCHFLAFNECLCIISNMIVSRFERHFPYEDTVRVFSCVDFAVRVKFQVGLAFG